LRLVDYSDPFSRSFLSWITWNECNEIKK
jgi:hypothetical protein